MILIEEKVRELRIYDDEYMTEIRAQKERIRLAKELGVPKSMHGEFSSVLELIYNTTIKVCGEIVKIGKILFTKALDFSKENPKLALGGLIGCVIALVGLVVPVVGSLVAPLVPFIGMSLGAVLDKLDREERIPDTDMLIFLEGATEVVKKFFGLANEVICAYRQEKRETIK